MRSCSQRHCLFICLSFEGTAHSQDQCDVQHCRLNHLSVVCVDSDGDRSPDLVRQILEHLSLGPPNHDGLTQDLAQLLLIAVSTAGIYSSFFIKTLRRGQPLSLLPSVVGEKDLQ